jgi:hypothetical protein
MRMEEQVVLVMKLVGDLAEASSMGMADTAEVVRRAHAAGVPIPQAKEYLVELARSGLVELRPESGLGRVSAADAALMPSVQHPLGGRLPLSWARPLSQRRQTRGQ